MEVQKKNKSTIETFLSQFEIKGNLKQRGISIKMLSWGLEIDPPGKKHKYFLLQVVSLSASSKNIFTNNTWLWRKLFVTSLFSQDFWKLNVFSFIFYCSKTFFSQTPVRSPIWRISLAPGFSLFPEDDLPQSGLIVTQKLD